MIFSMREGDQAIQFGRGVDIEAGKLRAADESGAVTLDVEGSHTLSRRKCASSGRHIAASHVLWKAPSHRSRQCQQVVTYSNAALRSCNHLKVAGRYSSVK